MHAADGTAVDGAEAAQAQAPTAAEPASREAAPPAADATGAAPVAAAAGSVVPDTADSAAAASSEAAAAPAGPDAGAEQVTSVAQTADAAATAAQDGVGNDTVSVQVDQPGDGSPVSQGNQAEGNAGATAVAETSGPATSDQAASATAQGTQSDVGNTAVSVRVGSAGDNGAVEQANVAAANASTAVTAPENGQGPVTEDAAATATQDGASNTNVSIRVFSPGSDGPVSQSNRADATANTSGPGGASATATQNGVQNTNVSVRVSSDGPSGHVTQQSGASATAGDTGVAIATTQGGLDTDVSVVVGGDQLARPGAHGLQVWTWTWSWDRDESVDALPSSTQPTSWDWAWGDAGAPAGAQQAQVTTRTVSADGYTPGSWTWNWDWTRDGAPNWAWQWNRTGQLPCGSCVWIWDWTWNWTGQPAQTGVTAAAGSSNTRGIPSRTQANVATAEAQATVTADVAQAITQSSPDGGAGEQYAGQLVSVQQAAGATATATQSDVGTVATVNLPGSQTNRVTGDATAAVGADLAQQVEQAMSLDGEGGAAQWSGQEIDLAQRARANVRSGQSGIVLRTGGASLADGRAVAAAAAGVEQRVAQEALVDGGTTDQWTGQLTLVEQTGDAAAVVEQTGAAAPRFVGGTARAGSVSGAVARVDQGLAQGAARGGGAGFQSAMQTVYVGQDGSADAMTTQRTGSAAGPATSEARATDRALVVQDGVQTSTGTSELEIQDLAQQSIVVQLAIAVSTSAGGIAGRAVVANCAVVQQTASQSLAGGAAVPASAGLSGFCAPPAPNGAAGATADGTVGEPVPASVPGGLAVQSVATVGLPPGELEGELFHGQPRLSDAARGTRAITPRLPLVRSGPGAGRPTPGSPAMTQISVPRPTQARLDTRPGDHAGAGDAGREPLLPPAGGPPSWVSALGAAASGTGPSGIAAILAAFMLVPPLLRRVREGSVVRRPIEALSQVDVPV